jgi:DNA-binding CsgD family transcriptional regulator
MARSGVGARARPQQPGATTPWPVVGRREELTLFEACLTEPDAAGVVVAGAPGVGKTRLVAEALDVAVRTGRATARATATEAASAIPLGALSHLLPVDSAAATSGLDLLRQARLALRARSRRDKLVLCVDDAHLLDPVSATLVQQLVTGGTAVVFVTVRTGEAAPDAVTALWKDHACTFLELQPLSRRETCGLVEAVLGGAIDGRAERVLWEASRGMPLVLRELVLDGLERGTLVERDELWHWRGELHAGRRLRELVAARLGSLDDEDRNVLETVAFGEPVAWAWLGEASRVDALIGRGVLEARREGRRVEVRFAHPVYREAVRADAPATRTLRVLRRLADAVEASGVRRRGDLLCLASWRLESGGSLAPELLVRAAQHAELAFAPALAERFAATAEEAGGGFIARYARARAVAAQGRPEEAELMLAALEPEAVTDAERAMVAESRARLLGGGLGRGPEAAAVVRAARGVVREPTWQAKLALAEAWLAFRFGRPAEAAALAAAALDDVAVDQRVRVLAAAFRAHMLAHVGRTEDAATLAAEWQAAGEGLPSDSTAARAEAAFAHTVALFLAGRLRAAAAEAETLYESAIERDDTELLGLASFLRCLVAVNRGRVADALKWSRESAEILREADPRGMLPWALAVCAQVAGQAGRADESTAAAAAAAAAARSSGSWVYSPSVAMGEAWASAAAGALTEARTSALAAARGRGDHLAAEFLDLHDLARLGDAAVAASRLRALAGRVQGPLVRACADHAEALAGGNAAGLAAAGRAFEDIDALLFAAEATSAAATAYRREGRLAGARACAARARTLLEQCAGARTPALAGTDEFEALTGREREIALLAAGGLSSRAIGERLVVSHRTVENHLQRAYRKLGIASRAELASVLHAVSDEVE